MRLPNRRTVRPGLSLLEVLIAVAIFLLAIGGITQLVTSASDRALDVQQRNQASRLCQQVLARVQCGDLPLNSQGDTAFDEDPDYTYSVTVNQGTPDRSDVNGLWTVIVKVTRERPIGDPVEVTLTQLILDPTVIGSTQDVTPITGSDSSSSSGSGGSTGSSGATGDSGAGAAAAPAKAAMPAKATTPAKAAMPAKAAAPAASGAASGTKGTTSTPATGKSGSSGGKGP